VTAFRSLAHRSAFAVAVAFVVVAAWITTPTIGIAAPSSAATTAAGNQSDMSQSDMSQSDMSQSDMRLVSQSPWVSPSGHFRITLALGQSGVGSQISATLYRPVKSQAALDQTGRGEKLGAPDHVVTVPLPVPTIDGTGHASIDLSYQLMPSGPDPAYGFTISEPGVYPIAFSIVDLNGTAEIPFVTHLIRLPDQTVARVPLAVALVVPMSSAVAHQSDGSVDLPTDQRIALESLTASLNRYPSVPVSVEPTPETLSALASSVEGARVTSPLKAKGLELLGLPYVEVDSGTWLDRGLTNFYKQQRDAGSATLTALVGTEPDHTTAVIDSHATPDVVALLAESGFSQGLVSKGDLEPTSSRPDLSTVTQTFELLGARGERLRAISTDPAITERFTATTDPTLDAHEVLAGLTLTALEPPSQPCVAETTTTSKCSRGVAIQLPNSASAAGPALDVFLAALNNRDGSAGEVPPPTPNSAARSIMSPLTLSALTSLVDESSASSTGPTRAPIERRLRPTELVPLGTYPTRLMAVADQVEGFQSMILSTDAKGTAVGESLDQIVWSSGASSFSDANRSSYLNGATTALRDQTDRITTPQGQTITFTSGEGRIPISIENALDYPVQVRLVLTSSKLEFPDGNVQIVDLPAGTPTRVDVPVRVRASGAFPIEVDVRSPDSKVLITSTRLTIRSTTVSGLGLVLTIIAGLFLLLWWARNFRKARRDRKLIGSSHPVFHPAPHDPSGVGS